MQKNGTDCVDFPILKIPEWYFLQCNLCDMFLKTGFFLNSLSETHLSEIPKKYVSLNKFSVNSASDEIYGRQNTRIAPLCS
jgi:hypothetical protein